MEVLFLKRRDAGARHGSEQPYVFDTLATAPFRTGPSDAKLATGINRLWATFAASGKPGEVQLQKTSGHEQLDDAAQAAVKRWSFAPAKQGNEPIDGWVSVPVDFKLN